MHCPYCHHPDTKVLDTRLVDEGHSIKRRRECNECHERFTTFEQVEYSMPQIIKRDNRRESFDVNKLRSGLARALEKRPIPSAKQDAMIETIIKQLRESGEKEIPSRRLGEWVMDALRNVDEVAYVRFASVYLSFQDLNAFRAEIERLERQHRQLSVHKNDLD